MFQDHTAFKRRNTNVVKKVAGKSWRVTKSSWNIFSVGVFMLAGTMVLRQEAAKIKEELTTW